jgi:hypothetical protein
MLPIADTLLFGCSLFIEQILLIVAIHSSQDLALSA